MAKPVREKIREAASPARSDPESVAVDEAEKKKAKGDKKLASTEAPEKSLVAKVIGEGEEARGVFAAAIVIFVLLFLSVVYFYPRDPAHSTTALTVLIQIVVGAVAYIVGKRRR